VAPYFPFSCIQKPKRGTVCAWYGGPLITLLDIDRIGQNWEYSNIYCYGKHNTDESQREQHPVPLSVGRHPHRPVCRSGMNNSATVLFCKAREAWERTRGHPAPPPSLPFFPPSASVPPAAACSSVAPQRVDSSLEHAIALSFKRSAQRGQTRRCAMSMAL